MNKLEKYIRTHNFSRPTLVIDVDQVEENYKKFKSGMPNAHVHYAIKANPHPKILKRLVELNSKFDCASIGEINMCIEAGASPEDISFGNTIKRPEDIKLAYELGIKIFAADSSEELEKIKKYAPNSNVFIRVLIDKSEAQWPLSRKFGCTTDMCMFLIKKSVSFNLNPIGVSFHIGSQTRHPEMWEENLKLVSDLWNKARNQGYKLTLLNIGGGFPSYYGDEITDTETYGIKLNNMISELFDGLEYLMIEPGRGLVGDAGYIACKVILVSVKDFNNKVRWVYLDIGKFHGLSETESEAIKYEFISIDNTSNIKLPCIVAGPTCDSADILYEKNKVMLPHGLKCGDRLIIKNCGAYTLTYSSIGFNGIPPLNAIVI